jgi:hypothetical protein
MVIEVFIELSFLDERVQKMPVQIRPKRLNGSLFARGDFNRWASGLRRLDYWRARMTIVWPLDYQFVICKEGHRVEAD